MTAEIALASLYPPRPYATWSHIHTAHSPRSRSHALRYFGFLSVWSDLQSPAVWQLGLGLLYVYPHNMCMWVVLDPPVSAFSLLLYRHPSIYLLFSSRSTSYNKQRPKDQSPLFDQSSTKSCPCPQLQWMRHELYGEVQLVSADSYLSLSTALVCATDYNGCMYNWYSEVKTTSRGGVGLVFLGFYSNK